MRIRGRARKFKPWLEKVPFKWRGIIRIYTVKSNIFGREERLNQQTSENLKKPKQKTLTLISRWRVSHLRGISRKKITIETRPKGCLFLNSILENFSEICKVLMARISLPVLLLGSCTKIFCKTNKNSSCITETSNVRLILDNNLSGQ